MEDKIQKRKEALVMMIKNVKTNPHLQKTDKKANTPPVQKEVVKQKVPQEKPYTLDMSGFHKQDDQDELHFYSPADLFDLSEEAKEKLKNDMMANIQAEAAEDDNEGGGELTDNSRRYTRMLVSAKSHMEVQDVLSAVYKDKMELIKAAAFGDESAKAIIRKLDKVIRRGNRKMRDLSKEIQLLQRQQRAEKKEQEEIARKVREELKRAQLERQQRERKYLDERDDDDDEETAPAISGPSMAATEAKIRALAQAMADLKSATVGTGDTASGDGVVAASADGGGEIAASGGDAAETGE